MRYSGKKKKTFLICCCPNMPSTCVAFTGKNWVRVPGLIRNKTICCWHMQVRACNDCTGAPRRVCVCVVLVLCQSRCLFVSLAHDPFSLNQNTNCCFSFSCCSQFSLYFLFVSKASVDSWPVALTTANHMPLLVVVNNLPFSMAYLLYLALFSQAVSSFPPSLPPVPLL